MFRRKLFFPFSEIHIKNGGVMFVQNIDTNLPDNMALPHRRQIPLQTTEFISRGIEKGNWREVHFKSFSSLSSLWDISTVNTHYHIHILGQYDDSINIQIVHTTTTQDLSEL